jgi:hypothetical protein
MNPALSNPFRPGAGHMPPYLAGRVAEAKEWGRLVRQDVILENLVLTGLRGTGKTVLLDTFKPVATGANWLWIGTDLSESSSLSEEHVVLRLLTDMAVVTAGFQVAEKERRAIGFGASTTKIPVRLDFETLDALYRGTPGLVSDKLRRVLEIAWAAIQARGIHGVVFAYDEAQNLADHAARQQYPLSLLLDVFQSIQKKEIPFMLALAGLPTLFPGLVQARTFSERMFRVVFLDRLTETESRDAIIKPIAAAGCPVKLNHRAVKQIIALSGGYPYFIQFVCREVYDAFLQGQRSIPVVEITRKLDSDFFAGRWARATDRQRDLLTVIAGLDSAGTEFTVQEIAAKSAQVGGKAFSPSHVNQMLAALAGNGLLYKNRHGKYCFAVPMFEKFIARQSGGAGSAGATPRRR